MRGNTALHVAVLWACCGADSEGTAKPNSGKLYEDGHADLGVLKRLLQAPHIDVNALNRDGLTPLSLVVLGLVSSVTHRPFFDVVWTEQS